MKKIYLLLLASSSLFAQIQKVEPPFWYAGMQNKDLQILFYGKNIAENTVSVSNNISIIGVQKTENPNYLFVSINTKDCPAQDFIFSFSKDNKVVFTHKYSLKSRRKDSALRKSFSSSDMIYLLMPDRFANGNPANDNSNFLTEKANRNNSGGRHGGDIEGIIKNLDYIASTGATAIWSTPLCEDNDPGYSYHTYAQSDVYQIDARYGTNEDYVRLSAEAKKKGLKLIKDYVTNHWGETHWMFKDLPTYNWFHQFPGYAQTNYRMATQFDSNASKEDATKCMDGWFVKSMPDLNQSNPLVLKYLTQNAIWWIEYADLDGFRVDTYSYNDKEAISKWTKAITNEYPYFNIVGEVWMHDQAQMAYWQKDSKIGAIQSYNSNLPSVMDFTLQDAIGAALNEDQASWDKGMIRFYDNFVNDFLYPNPNNLLIFAENHDVQRFNQMYPDFNKYQMTMAILATTRGIPQLYYGTEIGMKGDKAKGDGDIRQDFPGGWQEDAQSAFKKEQRSKLQNQYFDCTANLFNWRKIKKVIHTGKTMQFIPENNIYVYFRYDDNETVMVLVNNNSSEQKIATNRFKERIQNFKTGKDVLSKQIFKLTDDITIAGKTALVLELE
jgi:neopullulanase